ncbi:hypothetical protein ABIE44_001635 [Marmoricola sp. OAE513]|uniref:hypothetical protein n=1 Tax=Marmoricola sp. OAE513 TaxID=2817894 RepID=UPI001AE7F426
MKIRTLTVAAALTAGLGVTLAPAQALTPEPPSSTVATVDPASDVQRYSTHVPEPLPQYPAPNQTQGDITGSRLTHKSKTIRLRLRFAELDKVGYLHGYSIRFHGAKVDRSVVFAAYPGKRTPIDRVAYWRGDKPVLLGKFGNPRKCSGLKATISYKYDNVLVVIPRRCLGNPRWIEAGPRVSTRFAGANSSEVNYFDDAYSSGGKIGDKAPLGARAYTPSALD